MPIFDYRCTNSDCDYFDKDIFFRSSETVPDQKPCSKCGEASQKQFPLIGFTPSTYGDQTGKYGVNGVYDRGLGVKVQNERHRQRVMKDKGLAPLSDFDKHFIEDRTIQRQAEAAKEAKFAETYKENVKKFNGDKEKALVETMPAKEIISGKFD